MDFFIESQVKPFATFGDFPAVGAVKTIYIDEATNNQYYWDGANYAALSDTNKVPYTGATNDLNLGANDIYVNEVFLYDAVNDNYGSTHYTDGNYHIEDADGHKLLVIEDGFVQIHKTDTIQSNLFTSDLTETRDHYLPDESGTIALTSDLPNMPVIDTMLLVSCGNSISEQNKNTATGASKGLQLANILSGSPFEWKRITASTRTDIYGTYGFSGATLETILGDLEAQWFTPLAAGNLIPDVAFGYALLENDLTQGRTLTQMKSSLNAWIATVKNRWQGVKILLNTPHPSVTYNTAAIKERFTQISDYIMSLDNGVDIFCTKLDSYLSPTITGNPIVNTINGSISGTTLTVNTTDANINRSDIISVGAYSGRITAYGTGTGGAGTYTVDTSGTVATTNINLNKFASDGVHPNETGSLVNARSIKNTIARLGSVWKRNYIGFSNNMPVYGSIAAQSPGVGTIATGMNTSILPAGNTYLFEAQLPSVQETCTVPFSSGPSYPSINWFATGSIAVSGVTQMSPFLVFEILEGAENVKFIQLQARVNDLSGDNFQQFINPGTNSTEMTWENGDRVTVVYPPIVANSGSITALQNYIVLNTKLKGGTVKFRILSQGYYKIV